MKWQVVWMRGLEVVGCGEITTLASPQLRINLSPFTKDFRVEVQYNESIDAFLKCLGLSGALIEPKRKENPTGSYSRLLLPAAVMNNSAAKST